MSMVKKDWQDRVNWGISSEAHGRAVHIPIDLCSTLLPRNGEA